MVDEELKEAEIKISYGNKKSLPKDFKEEFYQKHNLFGLLPESDEEMNKELEEESKIRRLK